MLEIIFFIIFCLICGVIFLVLFKRQNKITNRTPVVLAKQILRYPERILVDIPLYVPLNKEESYKFLLETEFILASMGELKIRRRFVALVAEVFNVPSKDNLKELAVFLLHVAPEAFRDALRWDGKCDTAMYFLELMLQLIEEADKGKGSKNLKRISKKRGHLPKNLSGGLKDIDAIIIREWINLYNAVYQAGVLWQSHRNRVGIDKHFEIITNGDKCPHLMPFLMAARELYKSLPIDSH